MHPVPLSFANSCMIRTHTAHAIMCGPLSSSGWILSPCTFWSFTAKLCGGSCSSLAPARAPPCRFFLLLGQLVLDGRARLASSSAPRRLSRVPLASARTPRPSALDPLVLLLGRLVLLVLGPVLLLLRGVLFLRSFVIHGPRLMIAFHSHTSIGLKPHTLAHAVLHTVHATFHHSCFSYVTMSSYLFFHTTVLVPYSPSCPTFHTPRPCSPTFVLYCCKALFVE